jgi:hypothetical protein
MSDDSMVKVEVRETGEVTYVPSHWIDHPRLGKPFKIAEAKPASGTNARSARAEGK